MTTQTETTMPPIPTDPEALADYVAAQPDGVDEALAAQEGTARATRLLKAARTRLQRRAAQATAAAAKAAQPRNVGGRPRVSGAGGATWRETQGSIKLLAGQKELVEHAAAAEGVSRNEWIRRALEDLLRGRRPGKRDVAPLVSARLARTTGPKFVFIPEGTQNGRLDKLAQAYEGVTRIDLIRLAVTRRLAN